MIHRIFATIALGALVALAPGCSSPGGGTALPLGATAERGWPASLPSFRKHVRIQEFTDLPQYADYYSPSAVTVGPGGKLWVTDTVDQDFGENVVVAIGTYGKRRNTYYYSGATSEGASFNDITEGPDGALWITDSYNLQIVRMTDTGRFKNFPVGRSAPFGIAVGPDKNLWFTAEVLGSANAVERITTDGQVTSYPLSPQVFYITAGPDGALWFTEPYAPGIGRITTHGKITEYSKGITAEPLSIAAGPDGALWFTERASGGGRIGRITTGGRVTEYAAGITPAEEPNGIAAGPDGAMWFTECEDYSKASKIGRISMQGAITEYSKGLASQSGPTAIVAGPDNRMWFTEFFTDEMGRLTI